MLKFGRNFFSVLCASHTTRMPPKLNHVRYRYYWYMAPSSNQSVTIPKFSLDLLTHRFSATPNGSECPSSGHQGSKRLARKRVKKGTEGAKDCWRVVAYAAAEEFDLEALSGGLEKQGLYKSAILPEDVEDVMHVFAKYQVGTEPREVYIFREGSVVFWNVPELERISVLKFLRPYSSKAYDELLTQDENEILEYSYDTSHGPRLVHGKIFLNQDSSMDLPKYAFSNAMTSSVKLAIWENMLEQFVDSIEDVTEDLQSGRPIRLSRDQVLRKMGELFALRHNINLDSDLLDTPDFYWERENLEPLYQKTCSYLNLAKRTKVMNDKMNHCSELMQLLKDHLNDQHHVRLEVMIIVLIMIEVKVQMSHFVPPSNLDNHAAVFFAPLPEIWGIIKEF